jgi:hypothetical protein
MHDYLLYMWPSCQAINSKLIECKQSTKWSKTIILFLAIPQCFFLNLWNFGMVNDLNAYNEHCKFT